MSRFKVGDRVALATSPCDYLGRISRIEKDDDVALVELPPRYIHAFIVKLDQIAPYQEIPDMIDDEIYAMLKPKMDKSNVWTYGYRVVGYRDGHRLVRADDDVVKAIALAYRSGYLRAKKGRPFKIGGEKD